MRAHKREFDILRRVRVIEKSYLSHFGTNKRREITRLLYEISKKEKISPENILRGKELNNFIKLKTYLLKRRFPYIYSHAETLKPYLPKIGLSPHLCTKTGKKSTFYPKNIFVETSVKDSALAKRFKDTFTDSLYTQISSLKDYLRKRKKTSKIKEYNNRRDSVFITKENQDFFKKCPCTKGAVGCGYHIFNLSFGCIFECTYCYLQEYVNNPGVIFPANLDKFFDLFDSYKKPGMRIGTGEFSDSLMLDDTTEYSVSLIEFFKKHPKTTFELKTKSNNINNLLKTSHSGNIVTSWSLNPQRIINEDEFFTATLMERINAASRCAQAGYKLGFHFDPVIYYKGWERDYKRVIDMLFTTIKPKDIAWISIGTLRFNPNIKRIIETRFPDNKMLDEELVLGYDNKLRYPYGIRYNIYNTLIQKMLQHSKKLPIYLCMEEKSMCRELKLTPHFKG